MQILPSYVIKFYNHPLRLLKVIFNSRLSVTLYRNIEKCNFGKFTINNRREFKNQLSFIFAKENFIKFIHHIYSKSTFLFTHNWTKLCYNLSHKSYHSHDKRNRCAHKPSILSLSIAIFIFFQ